MNFFNVIFFIFTLAGSLLFLVGVSQYFFQVLKARLWTIRPTSLTFKYNDDEKKFINSAQRKLLIGSILILIGSLFKGLFLKYVQVLFNISAVFVLIGAWIVVFKNILKVNKIRYEIIILGKNNLENKMLYKSAIKQMFFGIIVFCGLISLMSYF